MKIYELEKGDLLYLKDSPSSGPFRFHGMDGMYARITTPEFADLSEAFKDERVAYISCGAEVEKLETSGTTSGGTP